jgi:hypothetical protein
MYILSIRMYAGETGKRKGFIYLETEAPPRMAVFGVSGLFTTWPEMNGKG